MEKETKQRSGSTKRKSTRIASQGTKRQKQAAQDSKQPKS